MHTLLFCLQSALVHLNESQGPPKNRRWSFVQTLLHLFFLVSVPLLLGMQYHVLLLLGSLGILPSPVLHSYLFAPSWNHWFLFFMMPEGALACHSPLTSCLWGPTPWTPAEELSPSDSLVFSGYSLVKCIKRG